MKRKSSQHTRALFLGDTKSVRMSDQGRAAHAALRAPVRAPRGRVLAGGLAPAAREVLLTGGAVLDGCVEAGYQEGRFC